MGMVVDSYRFAAAGGPFDPTDLPSLQLWYDFSDSAEVTLSGSEITSVASKGANSTALVRVGSAGPNGTSTTQNGLAVAAFDGSNDAMWLGVNANTAVVSQPFTVILAAKVVTRLSDEHLTDSSTAIGDRALVSGAGKWLMFAGTTVLSSTADSDTSWHCITAIFNGASSSLRIDGVEVASGNAGTNAITERWSIGVSASFYTACNVGDILVDATALSGTDLTDVEDYIATKWGTP